MSQPFGTLPRNRTLDPIVLLGGKACVVVIATGMLSLSGCDRVRTTSQSIAIAVQDGRGLPVPNATIKMKESWKSWQSWIPGGLKEDERASYRKRWKSDDIPWIEGSTDARGKAVLKLVVGELDSTRGTEPPAKRDYVSNREYIVRIQTEDGEEELLAEMKPGAVIRGKRYTAVMEAIDKPIYVARGTK